jgi:ferredoxin
VAATDAPAPAWLVEAGVPIAPRRVEVVYGLAVDEEPFLAADAAAAAAFPREVERGLALLGEACGAGRAELVRERPAFYPALSPGAYAVGAELLRHVAAAHERRPMVSRLVAVGGAVGRPGVWNLPIGVRAERAIEMAGGAVVAAPVIFFGGPLRGGAAAAGDGIGKATSAVTVLERSPRPGRAALKGAVSACMQCRLCTDLCPPAQLGAPLAPHRALRSFLFDDAAPPRDRLEAEAAHCTRCGVCLVACPFDLDPRAAYDATGVRFSLSLDGGGVPMLRLPAGRLIRRFGADEATVASLDREAGPIHEVSIPTEGARPRVSVATAVRRGQALTQLPHAHASIDGVVSAILSDRIVVRA